MAAYETNLASEFFVLATLSLGNKKAVDITVVRTAGDVATIDVKGVARKDDWPVGKVSTGMPERHFFLCWSVLKIKLLTHFPCQVYGLSRRLKLNHS